LSKKHLEGIIKIQLHHLAEKLNKQHIHLQLTPDAMAYIMEKGYDPAMGARPVKRVIQKDVMTSLSKAILAGKIQKEEPMVMDVFDGQVVFRAPIEGEELINT
jgi:ATP-dependent Clp protease ATP-binding subunit ClpB